MRRWAFRAAVVLSLVVLFSPRTPSEGGVYGLDKLVHLSLFAVVAATARLRFGRRLALVLVLLYAPLSETLQAVLPIGRDGDVFDAVFDVAGALVGWRLARRHAPSADRLPEARRTVLGVQGSRQQGGP